MARCGVPGIDLPLEQENDLNHKTKPCGCKLVHYAAPINGWVYSRKCDEHSRTMHRHHSFVDHAHTDHGHGACSDHAHWGMGSHPLGVDLEVSTPENDPLGWPA